jgi:hypothetical protein
MTTRIWVFAVAAALVGASAGCSKKKAPAAAEAQWAGTAPKPAGGNRCPAHEVLSGPEKGAACETCTVTNCQLSPAGDSGCCALSDPEDQTLCIAVMNCFLHPVGGKPNPCTRHGDAVNCFCGVNGGVACFSTPGAADGPCTREVIAAAKTSDPPAIHDRFTDPTSPLGRAFNLMNCRGFFCRIPCALN